MVVDDLVVVRGRAAVHDRLHRLRQGRAGADRRDRRRASPRAACRPAARWSAARRPSTPATSARTTSTWPAPRPAWSTPTGCSGRTASGRATCVDRDGVVGPALQRLLAGAQHRRRAPAPASTWTRAAGRARAAARRGAADPDPDLRPGLPGPGRRTARSRVRARHRRRAGRATWPGCCRRTRTPCSTGPPGAGSRSSTCSPSAGGVPGAELEQVFNMGVGMVAIVAPPDADRARQAAGRAGRAGLAAGRGHGPGRRICPAGWPASVGMTRLASVSRSRTRSGQTMAAARRRAQRNAEIGILRVSATQPPRPMRCQALQSMTRRSGSRCWSGPRRGRPSSQSSSLSSSGSSSSEYRSPRSAVAESSVAVMPVRVDAQLSPQPVKIRAAAAVLQLTGHLDLLGLGSAAPHWLDPL